MIYRTLNNSMSPEKFNEFIQSIPAACTEEITIYLDGAGGDLSIMYKYLDFIENYPAEITLVVTDRVISADFLLFILAKSKKRTSPVAIGYWHKAYATEISLSNNQEITRERNRVIKNVETVNKHIENQIFKVVTEEEIKMYNSNEDVYFDSSKMKEIAQKAESMFFS